MIRNHKQAKKSVQKIIKKVGWRTENRNRISQRVGSDTSNEIYYGNLYVGG